MLTLRQPGIEPGSTAWKAAMLTTIPLTLTLIGCLEVKSSDIYLNHHCFTVLMVKVGYKVKKKLTKNCHCRDQDSNLGYCGHNAGS